MKENNKLLFKEIILEDTQKIEGGISILDKVARPGGIAPITPELITLGKLKLK